MSWSVFLPQLAVMAIVTYLIRMLPLALFRTKISSRFVRSFLYYVPYAVLSAMTLPSMLYSAGSIPSAAAALIVALALAWREKSLLTVAVVASAAALITQVIVQLF